MRIDNRNLEDARPLAMQVDFLKNAQGSVLISTGNTQVLCTAMLEEGVPSFLEGSGKGWLTAEYAMLPASTPVRKKRNGLKADGRGIEIQRLIGRSLRSVCDFTSMGEYTLYVDCDVIAADGGTRTASISGAFVAVALCVQKAMEKDILQKSPLKGHVAAISAGIVRDEAMLDLCYIEDSGAQADMNMVATNDGNIGEIQVCGEKRTITEQEFETLKELCKKGIKEIITAQKIVLERKGICI